MPFDDTRVDTGGVDDRRGRGGGAIELGGGGLGIVGLVLYLVIAALGGGGGGLDTSGVGGPQAAPGGAESRAQLEHRCNTDGAIERYDDCYPIKVCNEINEVWDEDLARQGASYDAPTLGHEAGHHLQTLLGTEADVRRAQQQRPGRANELSVALELQADCYAGVYGRLANDRGNQTITAAELDQALGAAAAVGDDRIQAQTQGRVDPESFTHGTSAQRRQWFQTGYESGDLAACDTFSR